MVNITFISFDSVLLNSKTVLNLRASTIVNPVRLNTNIQILKKNLQLLKRKSIPVSVRNCVHVRDLPL